MGAGAGGDRVVRRDAAVVHSVLCVRRDPSVGLYVEAAVQPETGTGSRPRWAVAGRPAVRGPGGGSAVLEVHARKRIMVAVLASQQSNPRKPTAGITARGQGRPRGCRMRRRLRTRVSAVAAIRERRERGGDFYVFRHFPLFSMSPFDSNP